MGELEIISVAGDGSPALVVFDAGAVFDIAGNRNDPASFPLLEIPDTIKPFTFSPTIYFGNGSLELLASETLELTPRSFFNDTKVIFISSYVYGKPKYLPLDESHSLQGNNPYSFSQHTGIFIFLSFFFIFFLIILFFIKFLVSL